MARLPRICLPGITQHVIHRGSKRQACFISSDDFAAYADWLGEYSRKFDVAIHAYVFMTNHVHLLVTPNFEDGVSRLMQTLGRCYVRYFNSAHERRGTLWEGRFKSCVVEENRVLDCQKYIELNPVRAGLVESSDEYAWSSFRSNMSGNPYRLCTPHSAYQRLGQTTDERAAAYRDLFSGHLNSAILSEIRRASNQGLVLGSDQFKQEVGRLAGRRVVALKRGPKPTRVSGA